MNKKGLLRIIHFRCTDVEVERLKQEAVRRSVSLSELIRMAIADLLKSHKADGVKDA